MEQEAIGVMEQVTIVHVEQEAICIKEQIIIGDVEQEAIGEIYVQNISPSANRIFTFLCPHPII